MVDTAHVGGLLAAYILGSIPAAYIAGRLRGVDLRKHGSGNLGATNVYRVLGVWVAVAVFLFDAAKGALPVLMLPRLIPGGNPRLWAMAYGLAAILGHVRPIFLLWKGGGKGVATSAGVFAALAPLPTLIALALWGLVLKLSGYMSLASLTGAVALPVAILLVDGLHTPILPVSIGVSLFVFWTHRANLGRLRRGEESRLARGIRREEVQ